MMNETNNAITGVRPDVITYEDVCAAVPKLQGHERLVNTVLKWLQVDEVNRVHGRWCHDPGPEFTAHLVEDDFKLKLRIDGQDVLDNLPEGAFITVSNHPFGALDGIVLIYLITRHRPEFKVMVNMILNNIQAMRPNFIAVDAWSSNDPEKKRVSMNGIREALRMLREGKPVGFFPAGAMSKTTLRDGLQDRPWQKSVLQIIAKAKVPVVPVFFHGSNSWWFNFLGHACWPARSLRLPAEVFRKRGKEMHVSIGEPVSVEEQSLCSSPEELGKLLRERTYALKSNK